LMQDKQQRVARIKEILAEFPVEKEAANSLLEASGSSLLTEKTRAAKILLRPGVGLKEMIAAIPALRDRINESDPLILEQVEIQVKYDIYIEKEQELVAKMAALEELQIPETFNYDKLSAISTEARQKLNKIKPRTLGQASRISGVNPSDVQILMVYMGR
jgi:tRNA uridine 5-carboxymethylaminomethyl modification enzyme